MKAQEIRINWMTGWGNSPRAQILVDEIPEGLRYQKLGGKYFAEKDGYVSFFAWRGTPDRGFGGAKFHITLTDGEEVTLVGPWSSGSGAMMKAGFSHCMEISITADPEVIERGYTFFSGCVTTEWLEDSFKRLRPSLALEMYDIAGLDHYQIPKGIIDKAWENGDERGNHDNH